MSNNLAGYEFIETVGKGAMGSVYLARQTALNRFVAIKQVLGAWNGDPQALERFRREAQALARMNHPNVVGIYNMEAVGNDLYMIQEYVHGPSLKAVMSASRLTAGQALRVISEVSAGLDYASKQGILHRDLKPGNVFVTTTGVCKLGDFGLVKMMGGQGNFVTQVGTILGTPSYMSPEQAAGKAEIDQRADVYSLAVMSYELLVGRLPFPPVPGNVMASVEAHISTPPPRPSQVAQGFPARVEEVLLAGLAKDPRKRPRSAGEFWVKLADAGEKSWPGWAGGSDLASVAAALAPPSPADVARLASATGATAGAPTVAGAPPPPLDPRHWTISPLDTTALMAGSEETVVRPAAMSDETMVRPTGDETVVQGAAVGDRTLVQPAQSIHAGQPAGAPAFVPPPVGVPPAASTLPGLPAFSAPQVQGPVYKPPKAAKRRSFGARLLRALVGVLIVAALVAAAFWYFVVRTSGPAAAATSVQVTADPAVGHCPQAQYRFIGKILTNGGAGDITYHWIQPDGTPAAGPDTVQNVPSGQKELDVALQFTYTGNGNTSGAAQLKVLKPNTLDSNAAGVQYRCP